MHTMRKIIFLPILVLLALLLTFPVLAQSDSELQFSMSRDFGYASTNGKDIQGTFSMKVSGPEDLVKVTFFIDNTAIGEDTEAPFRVQFNTDSHPLGLHSLSATGITADGREVKSKVYERNFVSADQGWKDAMKFVGPILVLTLGISLVSILGPLLLGRKKRGSIPLGAARSYGTAGGTICSRCGRPFALNFFAPNMVIGKLVSCPHCGKVGVMARRSPAELQQAEEAERAMAVEGAPQVQGMSEEEKLQKELDDSRFQGM